MLATDNHIGYAENDPVRGQDSINAFREILQLAVANEVSLAGDLPTARSPTQTRPFESFGNLLAATDQHERILNFSQLFAGRFASFGWRLVSREPAFADFNVPDYHRLARVYPIV